MSRWLWLPPAATAVLGLAAWQAGAHGHPTAALAGWLLAYVAGGAESAWEGLRSLARGRVDVDFLMVVAAIGAAVVGRWEDGAILFFLFSTSNALQEYALNRTRQAVSALMGLRPDTATVVDEAGERRVRVEDVPLGARVVVRPGERIPLDGKVVEGASSVDQSAITGESAPVPKEPGDDVFAGTVNLDGVLEFRVERTAEQTTLARLVALVAEAQERKAQLQLWTERFEERYSLVVLAGTALTLLVPLLLWHEPFAQSFYRAMTVLVAASPCAVVIAAPAAVLSALASLARHGVLVKGGAHLERLATIDAVAFDKTGTLTSGRPQVVAVHAAPGYAEPDVVGLAAALEARVDHPLAHAIRQRASALAAPAPAVTDIQARAGRGVAGRLVESGQAAYVGSPAFIGDLGVRVPDALVDAVRRHEEAGETVVVVALGEEAVGVITMMDRPRPQAAAALQELHAAGVKEIVMLSGDQPRVVERVAAGLDIDTAYGGLLPEQKVAILKTLGKTRRVAMVGDGINDAPALASATVGVAMGGAGTDVALEAADVVLMGDDLRALAYAIRVARRTQAVIRQGLAFAVAVIVVLVALALSGRIGLPVGVVGHEGSTVVVVLSGLRMLLATPRHARVTARAGVGQVEMAERDAPNPAQ
ncbi:MAG: cadmium-translocating P-type ATPase [Clostridia bacterium]|nr:cadmium-translocating P-type ATPase [Clostridia bacterium]